MPSVRGHNEGTLFQRSRDARWVATVMMPDGHRRSRSARSKSEGVANLAALLRQRDQAVADPRRIRVGAYLRRWIDSLTGLAPATLRQHTMIVDRHLIPALGHRLLVSLTPSDVDAYLDSALTFQPRRRIDPTTGDRLPPQHEPLDAQTRRHHRATLRRALADAVRDGLVSRNVAAMSRAPRMQKAERVWLDADQARRVIVEGRDDRLWPLFVLILSTGLRVSEALGLAWSDVDLEQASLTVRYQLRRKRTTEPGYDPADPWVRSRPKTRRSRRTIGLIPQAVDALSVQRGRQDAERADHPRPIDGLVFTTPSGRPIHSTNVLPSWYALLKRLGLPRVTVHDCRHSAASIMLGAGIPLPVIADILGHSTMRVTADLYAHVGPSLRREATTAMSEALR